MTRKLLSLLVAVGLMALHALGQGRVITGKVTDDKGNPLPNVTVLVKGTNTGTATKSDGTYSISIPSGATVLSFSSVDMLPEDVTIGTLTDISPILKTQTRSMDEVVVVAYGAVKKEMLTGSVGQIKAEQMQKRAVGNITTAVEGAVPGLITTSANGQPGSGASMRVRGFGSINATSEPLFVVDGVPYTAGTSNINPDDVENITVLKDAASTALYGSRAANGVVMITTKKGKKGRNNIGFRGMYGVASRGLAEYDRVDAFEYYPIMWEAYRNSLVYPATGTGISLDSANRVASGLTTRTGIKDLLAYNPFNVAGNAIVGTDGKLNPNASLIYPDDLDWTTDLMRTGKRQDYTVNFNGGSDKADYYVSMGYLNEQGYTIKSDLKRYSARINVNVQPQTWIKTGLNIAGNYSVSNTANDDGSTNFVNPFFYSRNIGPIYPVYAHNMSTGDYVLDQNGQKIWDLGNFGTSAIGTANGIPNRPSGAFGGRHALAETSLNELMFRRSVVGIRNYVDIMFLKNFKFTNNIALDLQNQNNSTFENPLVGDGAPGGRSRRQSGSSTAFTASQLFSYGQKFGAHRVDALVGHESYNLQETDLNGFKQGQSLTGSTELPNFTTINSLTSNLDKYRVESFLSRVNYDYQNKYYVSGSIRRDGNSRFSSDARWGTFWSVGAGWNIHREDFMKSINWVDHLKLRSSYGVVGVADGIGYYAYQGLYGFANNANEPGIVQSQTSFYNPELTWETNNQFDIGVDFALFKNRISGFFEYYNRESADLLFAVPQPVSSGALTVNQNTATMYNRGFELQLAGDIIRKRDFTWNMIVNISTVTNKITKMPESVPEFITGTKKYAVGQSIFDYWLRSYYGVDPTDGSALYWALNTTTTANRRLITNKNGGVDTLTTSIANGKFEYQGGTIPDFYGSFTESFTYKGFTLSALFVFQVGGKTFDANYQGLMSAGTYGGAVHEDILKRWQKPGDITDVPRMDAGTQRLTDHNGTSSRWLTDASFINIRSANLSYNLSRALASKLKVSNAQVFVAGENLAFFSKRKGMNNQQAFSGVTSNAYPPARVLTVGLTFNL